MDNETDVYYSGLNLYYQSYDKFSKYIEYSGVKIAVPKQVGQILDKPNDLKENDFLSFLFENWNLLSYMLIGYLLLFFLGFIFLKKYFSHNPLKNLKLISSKLLFNDHIRLRELSSEFALILLFFNLFLFILINLLTSFIKTGAVVVNTDELIDSNEKLLSNSKILCSSNFNFLQFSKFSKSSLLFKLMKRKKEQNQYLTENNKTKINEIIKKEQSSTLFFFDIRLKVLSYLFWYSSATKNPVIFMKSTNYHESIYVYEMSRRLEKSKKKFINQWLSSI